MPDEYALEICLDTIRAGGSFTDTHLLSPLEQKAWDIVYHNSRLLTEFVSRCVAIYDAAELIEGWEATLAGGGE